MMWVWHTDRIQKEKKEEKKKKKKRWGIFVDVVWHRDRIQKGTKAWTISMMLMYQ